MKSLYDKHKCGLLVPLLLLIAVDVLAFVHITDDIVLFAISIKTELFIFTFSLTMTYYYLYKNNANIRLCVMWFVSLFKGKKK